MKRKIPWSALCMVVAALLFSLIAFQSFQSLNALHHLSPSESIPAEPHAFDYLIPQIQQMVHIIKIGVVGAVVFLVLAVIELFVFSKRI